MKKIRPIVFCLLIHAASVYGGSHTSANYSISTDVTDSGGGRSASADYSSDASLGGIDGISTALSAAEMIKHGYIGQLFETIGLQLSASPTTVNEGTLRQVNAARLIDDTTAVPLPAYSVTWSIVSGPLNFISSSGLATAATVYQPTNAIVRGTFGAFTATLQLTVLDSNPDNYGTYSGDGLADDWQVKYFGFNNPLAAPNADATGTGQNNQFKFLTGLNPVNRSASNAVLTFKIQPVPGQPTQKQLVFSPRYFDLNYTLNSRPVLTGAPWSPLTNFAISDAGKVRTVTDLDATGATKFYNIAVANPNLNVSTSFNSPTDIAHTEMLRVFRAGNDQQLGLSQVPAGTYDVYLWIVEDGSPKTVTVSIKGAVVSTYTTGPAGRWDRLGPFRATVTDGDIRVRVQCANANDVALLSGFEVWQGGGTSSPPPSRSRVFHRGINLGGPPVALEGNNWNSDTGTTPNFVTNGAIGGWGGAFNPAPTTPNHATMLGTFRNHPNLQIDLTSVPTGTYDLYVWTFEDNNSVSATLFVDGAVALANYNTGLAGIWERLGPFPVTVSDGVVEIDWVCTTPNDQGFLSGVELWRSWVPLTPPAGTFYRAINLGGSAIAIDGNNWEGEGAPNYTASGGIIPF